MFRTLILILAFIFSSNSYSQHKEDDPKRVLARKTNLVLIKKRAIDEIALNLKWCYLDYKKAVEMGEFIKKKWRGNEYDSTLNFDEFIYEVNTDLRKISGDKHIAIVPHNYKVKRESVKTISYSWYRLTKKINRIKRKRNFKRFVKTLKEDNFSYGEIKVLPGNIGYVEFFNFHPNIGKKDNRIKFKSVAKFLSGTNALIIDLRSNLGGSLNLVPYVLKYFLDDEYLFTVKRTVRLDSLGRDTIIYQKVMTEDWNKYSKLKNKPLFILTSDKTFSAAESMVYGLKKTHRAVIIGQTTGGGANGHYGASLLSNVAIVIPRFGIYDEDNRDFTWEGIGVYPDIPVGSQDALDVALDSARFYIGEDSLFSKVVYYNKSFKKDQSQSQYNYNLLDSVTAYQGQYGPLKVFSKDGSLTFIYDLYYPQKLVPKGKNLFTTSFFPLIKFIRNKNDEIISVEITRKDKYIERYRRKK